MYAFDLAIEDTVGVYRLTGDLLEPVDKLQLGFAFSLAKSLT